MRLGLLALWLVFLALAIPYVNRARHPSAPPLAAYLVFVSVFSLVSAMMFFGLGGLLTALHRADWLTHPAGAAVFLALVLVPAFVVARWQLRRPPRQPRGPPA